MPIRNIKLLDPPARYLVDQGDIDFEVRQFLSSPENLQATMEKMIRDIKMIQVAQRAVPHTRGPDDIDFSFDRVVDKMEDVLQHVANKIEENKLAHKVRTGGNNDWGRF